METTCCLCRHLGLLVVGAQQREKKKNKKKAKQTKDRLRKARRAAIKLIEFRLEIGKLGATWGPIVLR